MSEVTTTAAGGVHRDGRTLCSVVGCRRSKKGRWNWWICGDHWRQVPMWAKRRSTRIKRALRRHGEIESNAVSWWATSGRAQIIVDQLGRFLIRTANARAVGL